ncbi:hypothetical protein V8C86DRAFT_3026394 [Haematococcus lacustris]
MRLPLAACVSTALALGLSVSLGLLRPAQEVLRLELWRWAVLVACAGPTWYSPMVLLFVLVSCLEAQGPGGPAVYLLLSVRQHVVRCVRVAVGQVVVSLVLNTSPAKGHGTQLLLQQPPLTPAPAFVNHTHTKTPGPRPSPFAEPGSSARQGDAGPPPGCDPGCDPGSDPGSGMGPVTHLVTPGAMQPAWLTRLHQEWLASNGAGSQAAESRMAEGGGGGAGRAGAGGRGGQEAVREGERVPLLAKAAQVKDSTWSCIEGGAWSLGHSGREGQVRPGSKGLGSEAGGAAVPLDRTTSALPETSFFRVERHLRQHKLRLLLPSPAPTPHLSHGHSSCNSSSQTSSVQAVEVNTTWEAQQLAARLFANITGGSRPYIQVEDLYRLFADTEQAHEAMRLLAVPGNPTRITCGLFEEAVIAIYKERKKLSLTLQDTHSVVGKLELICGVVLHVVAAGVYLAIFKVSIQQLWVTLSSVVLAFVFVFGNSLRAIYESVIFLFVVHPFDVGDVLQLANGDIVKVESMALQFATFLRIDGKRQYYPNTKLLQEPCINMTRSEKFFDSVTVVVETSLPASVLDGVEAALKEYAVGHPRDYTGAVAVFARGVGQDNRLQVVARWEYSHTGEEVPYTNRCRSAMLLVLSQALEEAGVTYNATNINYNVDIPVAHLGAHKYPKELEDLTLFMATHKAA